MIALLRLVPIWLWIAGAACIALLVMWISLSNAQEDRDAAREAYSQEQAKSESLSTTLKLQRELNAEAQAVNDGYTTQVQALQADNSKLARDLAAGTRRLQLNATCVPATRDASAKPGADDAAPRLTATAERNYLDLSAGIDLQRAQITGLQNYINTVCLGKPRPRIFPGE